MKMSKIELIGNELCHEINLYTYWQRDYLFLAEFGTIKKGNNSVLRRRGVC